eukprot:TRINITY_DN15949_c0_g1_i1.p1 TRINITY_DN15949_c0_g1~~TRINITY_DN15949_c0_g1_i1.p1  ORF type:complete len:941 (-),score=186.80 TRINITY_DN15949_c0_g1_i1:48-2870(-)
MTTMLGAPVKRRDIQNTDPPVQDVVKAKTLTELQRLGKRVEIPKEELGFVTDEVLREILKPTALNGGHLYEDFNCGNVLDIYQKREDDFDSVAALEIKYQASNGEEVKETVFVDNAGLPIKHPRVCVSVTAIHAMHRAISVLTRKVDNLSLTLKSCREHYYKELFSLRFGREPTEKHEKYWFDPKAYEDNITIDMVRKRLGSEAAAREQEKNAQALEIQSLRDQVAEAAWNLEERVIQSIRQRSLPDLFNFMLESNELRKESFLKHFAEATAKLLEKTDAKDSHKKEDDVADVDSKTAMLQQELQAKQELVEELEDKLKQCEEELSDLISKPAEEWGDPGAIMAKAAGKLVNIAKRRGGLDAMREVNFREMLLENENRVKLVPEMQVLELEQKNAAWMRECSELKHKLEANKGELAKERRRRKEVESDLGKARANAETLQYKLESMKSNPCHRPHADQADVGVQADGWLERRPSTSAPLERRPSRAHPTQNIVFDQDLLDAEEAVNAATMALSMVPDVQKYLPGKTPTDHFPTLTKSLDEDHLALRDLTCETGTQTVVSVDQTSLAWSVLTTELGPKEAEYEDSFLMLCAGRLVQWCVGSLLALEPEIVRAQAAQAAIDRRLANFLQGTFTARPSEPCDSAGISAPVITISRRDVAERSKPAQKRASGADKYFMLDIERARQEELMSNPKPRSVVEKKMQAKMQAMNAVKAFNLGAATPHISGALPSPPPLRCSRPTTADKSRPTSARDQLAEQCLRPSSAQDTKRWPVGDTRRTTTPDDSPVRKRRPSAVDIATGCAVETVSSAASENGSASSVIDRSATALFGTEDSEVYSCIIAPEPPGPISRADALQKLADAVLRDAKPTTAKTARHVGRPTTPIGSRWRPETGQGGFTHRGARTILSGGNSPSSKHEEADEANSDALLSPKTSGPVLARQLLKFG